MPFEAAKAVAATFCWNIRYALTPVFGTDFPSQCIQPGSDRFGEMVIDCNITRRCTEEAKAYHSMEALASSRAASLMRSPLTPDSPTYPRHVKQLRAKGLRLGGKVSSGYSTDADSDDHYTLVPSMPHLPYRNTWTPANIPRSVVETRLPSPHEILAGIAAAAEQGKDLATDSSSSTGSPPLSPKSRRVYAMDEDYDGDSSAESSDGGGGGRRGGAMAKKQREMLHSPPAAAATSDEKAAYLLMSLRMNKTDLNKVARGTKRRAST